MITAKVNCKKSGKCTNIIQYPILTEKLILADNQFGTDTLVMQVLLPATIKQEKDALTVHHKHTHTHVHTNPRQYNPISAQINEGHIEMSRVMRQLTLPLTFTVLNKQSPSAEQKEPKNNKHIHASSGIKTRQRWRHTRSSQKQVKNTI